MHQPISIVVHYSAPHRCWVAFIHRYGKLITQARGRDESEAIADAVAAFRTSRYGRLHSK